MPFKKMYIFFLILILGWFPASLVAAQSKIIMSYWSYFGAASEVDQQPSNVLRDLDYPVSDSFNSLGKQVENQDMQDKLNYLNVIAYAFLHVNNRGVIYFNNDYIDLSPSDNSFCAKNKMICQNYSNNYDPVLGNFTAFVKLQNVSKTLKKLISIGGAGSELSFDNAITHIPNFVNSAATIIQYYHLDGIDLDFEPDSFSPQQANGYGKLLVALRQTLGPKAIIVVTIAADQDITRKNWQLLAGNASYVSDMCYGFHAPFYLPPITGYNSNLYSDANEPMADQYYHISCDQSIKTLAFLGVPPEKIILGYPSYGLVYGSVINKNNGLFQVFDPKSTPILDSTKHRGSIAYQTVLQLLKSGFQEHVTYENGYVSAVWAYNPITHLLLAYDNPSLVREKARYVKKNHLAGLMTWLIAYDAPVNNKASLLKAANE